MIREMRIVGLSEKIEKIFVQDRINGEWVQNKMGFREFEEKVKKEFPKYYKEFLIKGTRSLPQWFYYYGEEESNETYIFRN